MNILAKATKRILSLTLSLVLCTGGMLSCAKDGPNSDDTNADELSLSQTNETETTSTEPVIDPDFKMQDPTDKLTLYSYSMNSMMITPAVNIFNELYPDVEVEVVSMNDEEYATRISTEIPAGRGPDLILSPATDIGTDVYKTLQADLFVDLNQFLLRDDDFSLDGYVEPVMEAGVFHGKRCLLPIEYGILPLVTTEQVLDAEGLTEADLQTFDGFFSAAKQYNEKYADAEGKNAFSIGSVRRPMLRYFLLYGGLTLIDYETNTISIDETVFREVMDFLKDSTSPDSKINFSLGQGLIDGENLFDISFVHLNSAFIMEYARIRGAGQVPVTMMWRNTSDGVTAEIVNGAAIPKASENQVNAYRFMKILLSEEIQGGDNNGLTYLRYGHPVLEASVRSQIEDVFMSSDLEEEKTPERVGHYVDLVLSVDSANLGVPSALTGFVEEAMAPYWDGTKSYDECYDRLVNILELYKDE